MVMVFVPKKRCPDVVRPLFMPPYSKGMTLSSAMAKIHLMGLENLTAGSAQYMFFGKTSLRIRAGNRTGRIFRAGLPGSETSAQVYRTPSTSMGVSCSTDTPLLRAKPWAALVGLPAASKAAFQAGPLKVFTRSFCFSSMPRAIRTILLGVAKTERVSNPILDASRSSRATFSSVSRMSGRKREGISSVPISSTTFFIVTAFTSRIFPPGGSSWLFSGRRRPRSTFRPGFLFSRYNLSAL